MSSPQPSRSSSTRAGTIALVLGILFVLSVAWIFLVSLPAVNIPGLAAVPDWLRAPLSAGIPLGFFGTPIAFGAAWRTRGRDRGWIGLTIMLVGLVAFVILLFALG